ncbi:MAG TPA: hypothetical protein VFW41_11710 [Gaiellaceae bacterium]|nr:hypothetical protein [Gaiellaceae bacterium]
MKRLTIAVIVVAALASAGVAVAHGIEGGAQVATPVNASFTATSVTGSDTRTCTTAAGKTVASTKATYTGTASGSPDLTGAATIEARSVLDTTDGVGVVSGTLRIGKTQSHFSAVYDRGSIAGLASGHGATPHQQVLANVSATFSATGGFTNGRIGGTSGGSAVELSPGGCASVSPHATKAEGRVTASSSTSITVGRLTCAIPATFDVAALLGLQVGARAKIECSLVNGVETLVKVEARKH